MEFFSNLKFFVQGVSEANREFVSGVREVATEFKTDMIEVVKDNNPKLGKNIEKVDRLITTAKNGHERLPDTTGGPFNPDLQMKKVLKEIKKNNSIQNNSEEIGRAKHLKVERIGYSHHALSLGDGQVIHYSEGIVQIQSLKEFAKGAIIYKVDTPRTRSKDKVIQSAYSRLGENKYNLLFNNCEHFVRWCMNGAN